MLSRCLLKQKLVLLMRRHVRSKESSVPVLETDDVIRLFSIFKALSPWLSLVFFVSFVALSLSLSLSLQVLKCGCRSVALLVQEEGNL